MRNPHLSLKDRIVVRLTADPACFQMAEFSDVSGDWTTFCLAGIILDESGVIMEYGPEGLAVGLEEGEMQPASRWVDHEISLSARRVSRSSVTIAAKARELWAADHGDESARILPFYGPDWELDNGDVTLVKAEHVVDFLQIINLLAEARVAAAAA